MSNLGIDVGSSYVKFWFEDPSGRAYPSLNAHHHGSPQRSVLQGLERLPAVPSSVCFSGALGGSMLDHWRHEGLLAEIDFLRESYPHRKLLVFGAEKIEYAEFDEDGGILMYQTNPACAAGTGSFLDEQMRRLGLDFQDLPDIPLVEDAPAVATRCAVFAKTDLIHLQQEGYSTYSMYNGLCKGLVLSSLKSVFGGTLPDGSGMLATGGLLANPHVRHYLAKAFPRITVAEQPSFTRAMGLCRKARTNGRYGRSFLSALKAELPSPAPQDHLKCLELERSSFPTREMVRARDVYDNEVWHDLLQDECIDAFLGVDVGSTSTKAVLMDEGGNIRLDIYTRTSGSPIEATRRIFSGIRSLEHSLSCTLRIRGCGTTGSGRKLVGMVIGADLIVNEISAHARGALTVDQAVQTIFEIGGQDAKFIRMEGGRVVDVNMNYVCAAGTGSFVEEQARTLGMDLDDIGEMVMGVMPLPNSDRCTVFMNQEVSLQVASGLPRERIMAGVLLAVFRNYLGKVVGNRHFRRERIVFQGATARNRGLVAALEQITGAEVMVSPFCHVMGAYGAAQLAREKDRDETSFRGLSMPDVSVRESFCRCCENTCRITHATVGTEKTSWGYMCGREPGKTPKGRKASPCIHAREEALAVFAAFPPRSAEAVLMPALGLNEEFLPLLQEVLNACGMTLELFRPDRDEILAELASTGSGDFCYPVKVAMACVNILLKKHPSCLVLLPHLIQDEKDQSIHPRSLYCPFITALPGFYRQSAHARRILAPEIDLSMDTPRLAENMRSSLKASGVSSPNGRRFREALQRGLDRLRIYRHSVESGCRAVLDAIPAERSAIVLFGRPYNLYHRVLNLGIPELIESLGYPVITMDAVPDDAANSDATGLFPDLYWLQGLRMIRKALSLRSRPNLFPLMISNFSCGPDSFILTYFEEVCRDKPYLILELDEHGSATGYQTRIEAFLDMIEQHKGKTSRPPAAIQPRRVRYSINDIRGDTRIWIPQLHPYTPQLWCAALNRFGFDAQPTGEETTAECAAGRALCRGSECLPAAVTTGKFLSVLEKAPKDKTHVLFMPRAEGPCRFGQYATLQSLILERSGAGNTLIFSPTSENGYSFLTPRMELAVWKAICLGDALFKLRCRVVPYHDNPEDAETLIIKALGEICGLIRVGRDWKGTVRSLTDALSSGIHAGREQKPLVGIVGEIFVRLNSFSNQHIVQTIEEYGGEAWLSPMSEWVYYVWDIVAGKAALPRGLKTRLKSRFLHMVEKRIMGLFSPVLDERHEPALGRVMAEGGHFLPRAFEGESILTIGRAKIFAEQGAHLVVNCSPFGCMPGRITSYIFQAFRDHFKVPVVNLFFDGTGDIAGQVGVYLQTTGRPSEEGSPAIHSVFSRRRTTPSGKTDAAPERSQRPANDSSPMRGD